MFQAKQLTALLRTHASFNSEVWMRLRGHLSVWLKQHLRARHARPGGTVREPGRTIVLTKVTVDTVPASARTR